MFYIVSRGSTATHWLAKNISKHPDLVCFYASRSFPPLEPGKAYPTNKGTWVKEPLEPKKYLDSLRLCEQATHNSKIFGSIHGYHEIEMEQLVEDMGGTFKYMVRHPLEQVHSAFIYYCNRYFKSANINIQNKDIHKYVCEKLKNQKTSKIHFKKKEEKSHFLKKYINEKNFQNLKKIKNLTIGNLNFLKKTSKYNAKNENEELLNIFSNISLSFLYIQNLYFKKWGIKKAIKMENIFTDKAYFKKLLEDLAPGIEVSEEYLDLIYADSNKRINIHRDKPILNKQIYEEIPDCLKEIFAFHFKNFQIKKYCEVFNYKILF